MDFNSLILKTIDYFTVVFKMLINQVKKPIQNLHKKISNMDEKFNTGIEFLEESRSVMNTKPNKSNK